MERPVITSKIDDFEKKIVIKHVIFNVNRYVARKYSG